MEQSDKKKGERNKACEELQECLEEDKLWECIELYQGYRFLTASGLPFTYTIKIGRSGRYTKELIIDRRSESKTLTWSSVRLAFENAVCKKGEIIPKPKALGDIRGISYIYPLFYHFGIINVPEDIEQRWRDGKDKNQVC